MQHFSFRAYKNNRLQYFSREEFDALQNSSQNNQLVIHKFGKSNLPVIVGKDMCMKE